MRIWRSSPVAISATRTGPRSTNSVYRISLHLQRVAVPVGDGDGRLLFGPRTAGKKEAMITVLDLFVYLSIHESRAACIGQAMGTRSGSRPLSHLGCGQSAGGPSWLPFPFRPGLSQK